MRTKFNLPIILFLFVFAIVSCQDSVMLKSDLITQRNNDVIDATIDPNTNTYISLSLKNFSRSSSAVSCHGVKMIDIVISGNDQSVEETLILDSNCGVSMGVSLESGFSYLIQGYAKKSEIDENPMYAEETVLSEKNSIKYIVLKFQKTNEKDWGETVITADVNLGPEINNVIVEPFYICPNKTGNLKVNAVDSDSGDTLSYEWSSKDGTFTDKNSPTTSFIPNPNFTGLASINIRVFDSNGGKTNSWIKVQVKESCNTSDDDENEFIYYPFPIKIISTIPIDLYSESIYIAYDELPTNGNSEYSGIRALKKENDTWKSSYVSSTLSTELNTIDINGDNIDDLISKNVIGEYQKAQTTQGAYSFSNMFPYNMSGPTRFLTACDLNQDGVAEVVYQTDNGAWYKDSISKTYKKVWDETISNQDWMDCGDFNGDSIGDLVFVDNSSNIASISISYTKGTSWNLLKKDIELLDTTVCDMNGDGKDDLVIGNFFESKYYSLDSTNTQTQLKETMFTTYSGNSAEYFIQSINCGDINDLGKGDIIEQWTDKITVTYGEDKSNETILNSTVSSISVFKMIKK